MNPTRRLFGAAAAAMALIAILAGCASHQGTGTALHPNLIVVRDFTLPQDVITLDPSFGFSLYRGAPGVPPRQRAESVGRAAAFNLADEATQELSARGYDTVRSDTAVPDPGGRALIVTGAFRSIYEGHRHRGTAIVVDVEVDYQAAGKAPKRLSAFSLDSRRLPAAPLAGVSHSGGGVESAAAQIGAAIGRYVADTARRNKWPDAGR